MLQRGFFCEQSQLCYGVPKGRKLSGLTNSVSKTLVLLLASAGQLLFFAALVYIFNLTKIYIFSGTI